MRADFRRLIGAIQSFVESPPPGTTTDQLEALGNAANSLLDPQLNQTLSPGENAVKEASGEEPPVRIKEKADMELTPGEQAAQAAATVKS